MDPESTIIIRRELSDRFKNEDIRRERLRFGSACSLSIAGLTSLATNFYDIIKEPPENTSNAKAFALVTSGLLVYTGAILLYDSITRLRRR